MSSAKTTIPTVECEVIGNIEWNCFIHDFMKEIHIIEKLNRKDKGGILLLTCLHLIT